MIWKPLSQEFRVYVVFFWGGGKEGKRRKYSTSGLWISYLPFLYIFFIPKKDFLIWCTRSLWLNDIRNPWNLKLIVYTAFIHFPSNFPLHFYFRETFTVFQIQLILKFWGAFSPPHPSSWKKKYIFKKRIRKNEKLNY